MGKIMEGGGAGSVTGTTGVTAVADNTLRYKYSDLDLTRKLSINGVTVVNATLPTSLAQFAGFINTATYPGGSEVEAVVNPNGEIFISPYFCECREEYGVRLSNCRAKY